MIFLLTLKTTRSYLHRLDKTPERDGRTDRIGLAKKTAVYILSTLRAMRARCKNTTHMMITDSVILWDDEIWRRSTQRCLVAEPL